MRGFFNGLLIRVKNSSLQSKLFFSYFILIFVPIVALSFFSYSKSAQVIVDQSMDISRLYLWQTENLLDEQLSKMISISQVISQSLDIRDLLEQKNQGLSFSEEFDAVKELNKTITNIRGLYDVYQIRLYISPNFRYSRSNYITYDMTDLEGEDWYREMLENARTTIVRPPYLFRSPMEPNRELVSVVTLIRSYRDIHDILGVVSVDVPVDELRELLTTADFTKAGSVVLLDSEGETVCSTGDFGGGSAELLEKAASRFPDSLGVLHDGGEAVGLSGPLPGDWRIFSVVSLESLLADSRRLREQLILFAVFVGVIVYFLAYFYSRHNTKRIRELVGLMNRAEQGDFQVKCMVDSEDEIGELQSSFNFMVRKISTLLGERYDLGKSLKETELKALQAQINPHFLYNTLDLISWKAQKGGNPEISDIVCKMARFYQLSLSNGSDVVPLADELEHIRLYVELQNLRFEHAVRLETELEPAAADCPIMKLILQPIVENSIAHGILDREDGVIRIQARLEGGDLHIRVSDNGIGIEKPKLMGIRSHDQARQIDSSRHGFGLLNIIDRLKVYYNGNYDFDIDSVVGRGTAVAIRIPAQMRRDAPRQTGEMG